MDKEVTLAPTFLAVSPHVPVVYFLTVWPCLHMLAVTSSCLCIVLAPRQYLLVGRTRRLPCFTTMYSISPNNDRAVRNTIGNRPPFNNNPSPDILKVSTATPVPEHWELLMNEQEQGVPAILQSGPPANGSLDQRPPIQKQSTPTVGRAM